MLLRSFMLRFSADEMKMLKAFIEDFQPFSFASLCAGTGSHPLAQSAEPPHIPPPASGSAPATFLCVACR